MDTIPYTLPNSNLYHAVLTGDMELARECLAEGANPNYIEINRTTLTAAVIENNLEMARLLLDHGADPNLKSKDGLTPLMQANGGDMIRLLAEYDADPNVTDGRATAINYYVAYNCVDTAKAWLQLGWPMIRITKRLLNRLLIKGKFEMITMLTGFKFESEDFLVRMAEFKARYV